MRPFIMRRVESKDLIIIINIDGSDVYFIDSEGHLDVKDLGEISPDYTHEGFVTENGRST